ncbi:glycosyltransferase family 2 protein [Alteromonas sp. RKMC-009]|uniref:glycosyltransferase family 2 protein n=1 Tax=Alteromonas sp. RKMC-009 TaxID=2267264 RepID=UPI000E6803B7|nr:glycosyltransferase family 2 protein [Alteromonas sp. RKMC-009]AYA63010.1 glycosyltransferase [Alteromonas sp. RKMC-009]
MKKIAMQSVQMAIKLVPSPIREKVKRSERLTTFYSQSIRRSGLTYGEPTKRTKKKLYREFVSHHNKLIENVSFRNEPADLLVVVAGESGHEKTIKNLKSLNLPYVIWPAKKDEKGCPEFNELLLNKNTGSHVLLINAGDTLRPQSCYMMSALLQQDSYDLVYCDTDITADPKKPGSPHFLPDWNPELQLSAGYVSTGVLIKRELLNTVQLSAVSIAGLTSEIWLQKSDMRVGHIPSVLVIRDEEAHARQEVSALEDIARLTKQHTDAVPALNVEQKINHVQWPVKEQPLVSLVIPTKNAKELVKTCIDSIREKTLYKNYEIILIDNGSDEKESLEYFASLDALPEIRVIKYPGPFNYSAINNFGVSHAKGEIIGLINNDIEVIKPDWLTYMVGHAMRDDVGCVGAKLLYSDGCIQHAGVVLGYGGGAGHAHKYFPRYHPGYMKRLLATQNYSAVTAACLLVKKSKFLEVGGLNEQDLAVAFNDVDFCLRVRETGVRNVFCAEAELYHHESVSRGLDVAPEKAARFNRELEYLRSQWHAYISHDPAYSPNLTLKRENFSIKRREEFTALGPPTF